MKIAISALLVATGMGLIDTSSAEHNMPTSHLKGLQSGETKQGRLLRGQGGNDVSVKRGYNKAHALEPLSNR